MASKKKSSTARGLGQEHRRIRAQLLAALIDGTLCPCQPGCGPKCPCQELPPGQGLPIFRDAARNVDGRPLEADHVVARAQGGRRATRLLLSTCNRSRGEGELTKLVTSREW